MQLKIDKVARHRNGLSGAPFYIILFRWRDGKAFRNMIATVFDFDPDEEKKPPRSPRVAVIDRDELANENIAFLEGNSWRGDYFAPDLYAAIKWHSK